jgi:hypothetical protein
MHRGLLPVDYHGENRLVTDLEGPYQKRQQRTKFTCPVRIDRNRVPVTGGGDFEFGVVSEQSTDPFKVAARSGGIELSHQGVDLDPGYHNFVLSHAAMCGSRMPRHANVGFRPIDKGSERSHRRFARSRIGQTHAPLSHTRTSDPSDIGQDSFNNLLTSLLMVEIDRKFAGVMSDIGIIRSNSDSTSSTILTVSSEVRPTSARISSAQTDRSMERSSKTCWTTVTIRSSGEKVCSLDFTLAIVAHL